MWRPAPWSGCSSNASSFSRPASARASRFPTGRCRSSDTQFAGLLIVPEGLEFAAIDGLKVNILFAVIGPKRATGEHLKTLARVSRLLRNKAFRDRLVAASGPDEVYSLIATEEGERVRQHDDAGGQRASRRTAASHRSS